MTKISRQNVGGVEYIMVGCAVNGTCVSSEAGFIKAVTLTDTDIVADGMTLIVNFTKGNTAGTAPEHITLYSSNQINYYTDPQLTQAYGLAPAGCYQIEYTGEGNAYDYISYPVLQIGGVNYPICDQHGAYVGGAVWGDGDSVSFTIADGKARTIVIVNDSSQLDSKVDKTTTVNGHPLSSNVVVTKADVGLGNVVNTGDSATPAQGGTDKFTTGGAYTELNKKLDKYEKGVANGVATLDASGRVPYSQLPESAMEYEGKWDASTNTPTLKDGDGVNGEFYIVSAAGTVNFGTEQYPRMVTFDVDDRVIYDGNTHQWDKLPAGNVRTVNGQTGEVELEASDIPYNSSISTKDAIDTKVTKVTGKGLSTNDFTDALKTKLEGIEDGAQVNSVTGVKGESETDYRTGNVNITKSNVGLSNVVNTGDSATPVEGGTTKFTTGGAYTEFAKKVDKTTTVNGHALSGNVSVTKSDIGLGSVVNTGDSATPVEGGTTKFTTGGAYTELAKKVDKEDGKILSTNDFTNADKTKLNGIADGAEVNVQADWTQTCNACDSYIKNKPTLATVATSGKYCDLSGLPTIPAAQIQSDWTQTCNACKDYIKNKPTLATVATSGKYCDLSGAPSLAAVATSGKYCDLSGTPSLATVATTGCYNDLTGKPTILSMCDKAAANAETPVALCTGTTCVGKSTGCGLTFNTCTGALSAPTGKFTRSQYCNCYVVGCCFCKADNSGYPTFRLIADATTWWNCCGTSGSVSAQGLLGDLYVQRISGYMNCDIGKIAAYFNYRRDAASPTGVSNLSTLGLHYQVHFGTTYACPFMVCDTVNNKKYIALKLTGSGKAYTFNGFINGSICPLSCNTYEYCYTDASTMPAGWCTIINGSVTPVSTMCVSYASCASKNGSGTSFGTAAVCDASCFRSATWTPTCVACAGANGSGTAFGTAAVCSADCFYTKGQTITLGTGCATQSAGVICGKGNKSTNALICFLNNTNDTYGNGVSIGGGGTVIIGAGESAATVWCNLNASSANLYGAAAGTETLYLASDGAINIFTNVNSGYSCRKTVTIDTNGYVTAACFCGCADDAAKLGGTAASSYLKTTGCAADSAKLGGTAASGYLKTTGCAADSAKLTGKAPSALCVACAGANGSGTAFGTAATKAAGSAAGNVPLVGTALGTTADKIVLTDAAGKLKPSACTVGSAAYCDASCFSGPASLGDNCFRYGRNEIIATCTVSCDVQNRICAYTAACCFDTATNLLCACGVGCATNSICAHADNIAHSEIASISNCCSAFACVCVCAGCYAYMCFCNIACNDACLCMINCSTCYATTYVEACSVCRAAATHVGSISPNCNAFTYVNSKGARYSNTVIGSCSGCNDISIVWTCLLSVIADTTNRICRCAFITEQPDRMCIGFSCWVNGTQKFSKWTRLAYIDENDSNNIKSDLQTKSDLPVGMVLPYYGTTPPNSDWLPCDGSTFNTTTYPELYTLLGSNTTPDLRETVVVGTGRRGSGVSDHDEYTLGQFKDDQVQYHGHNITLYSDITNGQVEAVARTGYSPYKSYAASTNTQSGRGGNTTHGKQLGLLYIIKAR